MIPLNIVVDDEKTLNIVAGLVMPGPGLFSEEKESQELHEQHKTWISNSMLFTTLAHGLEQIRYHSWAAIYLDYDIQKNKGTEITAFLKENRKRIPADLYL